MQEEVNEYTEEQIEQLESQLLYHQLMMDTEHDFIHNES